MRLTFQTPLEGPLVPPNLLSPDVQLWRDSAGEVFAYAYRGGGGWVLDIPGVAAYRFAEKGSVAARPYRGAPRIVVTDVYQRCVRQLVIQARGAEVLHASAVVAGDGVVALCGQSESGKSTLAFALGQRGYPVWGDDTLAFQVKADTILAIPLGFTLRLRPASARYFNLGEPGAERVVRVQRFTKTGSVRPLAALFVLKPSANPPGPRVVAIPLAPVEAFLALLPHVFCLTLKDVPRTSSMLNHYLELAGRVPVYQIHFGTGLDNIDRVIDAVEERVLRGCSPVQAMNAGRP